MQTCPLCNDAGTPEFQGDGARPYFRCPSCRLVFVPAPFHLTTHEERQRYELHQNDPKDDAYRAFLMKLGAPLMERLEHGAYGLDYGSGPGPTLSVILAEHGFPTMIYDPFFADDPAVLEKQYDFLTCTETVEHFRNPARDWQQMLELVKPGGWIGVMTSLITAETNFTNWHYARDDTHVAFYSRETLEWIANKYSLHHEIIGSSVILMQRT